MTKKIKTALLTLSLVLVSSFGVQSAFSKYTTSFDLTPFNLSIEKSIPKEIYAVYSADDKSLEFFCDEAKPEVGTTHARTNKTVTKLYTGFDTAVYTSYSALPWGQDIIATIKIVDKGIAPVSTAFWFSRASTTVDYVADRVNALQSIDFENLDTSNVTNMSHMFAYCVNFTSLDVSTLNTSNVKNMSYMFRNCYKLSDFNLNTFNTDNVDNMAGMFYSCISSTLNINGLNTSNVSNMYEMFYNCNQVTTLDLSGFDTSKVTNMARMFMSTRKLQTIYVSNTWSTNNVSSSSSMFSNCALLVGGNNTPFNSSIVDKTYARIDGKDDKPGYFTEKQTVIN